MCGCFLHIPYWGPGPQPRHVLCLGIEPVTLLFAGQGSIYLATPARAGASVLTCKVEQVKAAIPPRAGRESWYLGDP